MLHGAKALVSDQGIVLDPTREEEDTYHQR